MRVGLLISALALTGAFACKTPEGKKLEAFQDSVEAYNDAYRWKNYERAAAFLPADLRGAFVATYEDDKKSLHVEDYKILEAEMDSEDAARVVVRVRYMLLPSVTVQKRTLVQHWHRVDGSWILENEDNSIRDIDESLMPDTDAFGGGEAPEGAEADVEVTAPDGEVIRSDGDWDEAPAAEGDESHE